MAKKITNNSASYGNLFFCIQIKCSATNAANSIKTSTNRSKKPCFFPKKINFLFQERATSGQRAPVLLLDAFVKSAQLLQWCSFFSVSWGHRSQRNYTKNCTVLALGCGVPPVLESEGLKAENFIFYLLGYKNPKTQHHETQNPKNPSANNFPKPTNENLRDTIFLYVEPLGTLPGLLDSWYLH